MTVVRLTSFQINTARKHRMVALSEAIQRSIDDQAAVAIGPSRISPGGVHADAIDVDALQTTNYAEDGNGIPTAGAKLSKSGDALKAAAGAIQLGYQAVVSIPSGGSPSFVGTPKGISSVGLTATPKRLILNFPTFAGKKYFVLVQDFSGGTRRYNPNNCGDTFCWVEAFFGTTQVDIDSISPTLNCAVIALW